MEQLAVFAPLCAFLIAFLFGKQIGDRGAQFVTCAALIVSAIASCLLFKDVIFANNFAGDPRTVHLMNWITSGDLIVDWSLRIDQLTVVMMCVVAIVSACVHVYSVGYMSHDPCKARFMSYLSLFTFAMLMLVTSDNLVQLFFGWEGVGVASYLLIGFWNHKKTANDAAIKAFLVNRVGDFGLALGIFAAFALFGTVEFTKLFEMAPEYAEKTLNFLGYDVHAMSLVCLLLFMGAMGKSAQLGLHTWLPDAMEGPTPVSALIHAATMVTAGVFLVARMSPLYEYAPFALMVVCVVGALTAVVAASIGLTQFDIKRVIAYSTMSQLGYMFFALGVSAYAAAIFHLMTHAFFKALLFLGAGSVIHAMSDEQDMRKMGGIWKMIPTTYVLMWIGSLALCGVPFFAGYFSKDIVLEAAWADHTWFGTFAYWAGITAAVMTAFYSGRLLFMTFHGKSRADKKVLDHVHESPPVMIAPLLVLAAGAILAGGTFYGGFVGSSEVHGGDHGKKTSYESHDSHGGDHKADKGHKEKTIDEKLDSYASGHFVNLWSREYFWGESLFVKRGNDTIEAAHHVPKWVKYLPTFVAVLGLFLAWLFYVRMPELPGAFVRRAGFVHTTLFRKYFFDEIYHVLFVKPAFALGQVFWIAGDQKTIDGLGPNGIAKLSKICANGLSRFQSGYMFQYAFVMMVGLIALVSWFFYRSSLQLPFFGG